MSEKRDEDVMNVLWSGKQTKDFVKRDPSVAKSAWERPGKAFFKVDFHVTN